jgi:glycosyltransferase involved in cell wall biosynthesis
MPKKPTAVVCLSTVNGGMELAAVKLARLLSETIPIHFIVKKDGFIATECAPQLSGYDVKLHTIGFKHFFSLKLVHEARKYVKEHGIKNVIFLGASEMRSLYFAFKGLNINLIIRQGSRKSTPKKDLLHRLVYSDVRAFVGNCDYIKQNIKEVLPLGPCATLTRIYSSVKLHDLSGLNRQSNRIELISVGRINPGKGQLISIKACRALYEHNVDFRLRLLGNIQDTGYYHDIKRYLEECPYKERIEFLGYQADIDQYLMQSDIFLFPTKGEGMSNAVIEALGYGLIPIVYNNTSAPEFPHLGFHIHLIEDKNAEAFTRKLLSVCQNFSGEKAKAAHNIKLARRVFSPEREKTEYLDLLI